jgi:hypothetical protein
MTHAPDPGAFLSSPTPSVPWWWQLLDADGTVVGPEDGRQEFPTRADAESWVGEFWPDLADAGVAAVTLYEGDREVYGPMPLSA